MQDQNSSLPPDLQAKLDRWTANAAAEEGGKAEAKESQDNMNGLAQALQAATQTFTSVSVLLQQADSRDEKVAKLLTQMVSKIDATLRSLEKNGENVGDESVVKAVNELKAAMVATNDRQMPAPRVTVSAPDIDTSGIEAALDRVPGAIRDAVKMPDIKMPTFDNSEVVDRLESMIRRLDDIDKGVRMKPEPGVMKVTNTDGSAVNSVGDGTNNANVLKSDGTAAGQNSLMVANAYLSVPFTTTSVSMVGTTDVGNYRWVSVYIATQGTTSTVTFQTSNDNTNWTSISLIRLDNQSVGSTATLANVNYAGNIGGRYFRLNITGIAGGTTAGTILFSTLPSANTALLAAQSGTWTVGSNSATGSAVPANAFYLGGNNGTSLQGLNTLPNVSTDGIAGSGTLSVGPEVYNGTTWDRIRTATSATNTVGTGLLGVGNLMLDGASAWQALRTFSSAGDASSTTTPLAVAQSAYNNANVDRMRNNVTGAPIAAGTTTTQTGITFINYNGKELMILLNVSAVTGGTVTLAINGTSASGYLTNLLTGVAVATTGVFAYRVFPGATPTANLVVNDLVPRNISLTATVVGTITYGIDYILSL